MVFTTLAHHIDLELLHEAYGKTRKDGAPGIDGQRATEYAANLEGNLRSLLDRFKSGTYRAPPVRRVYIPKADGKTQRPIGIPTFEDKVLQRAVTMVLEAVYEQDFLDCSYGFRPNRSAHQALEALWRGLMDMGGGVVIEVDIKGYFDTIPIEIEEAAMIDGCGPIQSFILIGLPMAKPALAVTALLAFMGGWGEFVFASVLIPSPNEARTLMVGMYSLANTQSVPWGYFAAGAVMTIVPVILVYTYFQKYLVGGLTLGGVKG